MQLNLVKQHLCTTIVENIGYLEIITNFCADCETKNQGQNQTKTKCNKVQPPHNESVETNIDEQFLLLIDKHLPRH